MRFYKGRPRFTAGEALSVITSVIVAVSLACVTWGLTVFAVLVLWFSYYRHEKRQEALMRQRADDYRSLLESEEKRITLLESYDSYLTNRARKSYEKPLRTIVDSLHALPQKYGDLWKPIKHIAESWLEFLTEYNPHYFEEQKKRHAAFFNGQEYNEKQGFSDEQVRAILTNDYNNLVVAGPGAGKTMVLTARVAFSVYHQGVPQERILVLAYNKSAAEEVRSRLRDRYGIVGVKVTTFHGFGFGVLRGAGQVNRRNAVEDRSEQSLSRVIDELLESNGEFQRAFQQYLSAWEPTGASASRDPRHITEQLQQKMQESYRAIDGTAVQSLAERDITNYFIRHGIAYEYEREVAWCDKDPVNPNRRYCPDFYLPEHDVYLEHWSMDSDNKTPDFYTHEESTRYVKHMVWKRDQFQKHKKTLWETNHNMYVHGQLLTEIERRLKEIGIEPVPIGRSDLLKKAGLSPEVSNVVRESIIMAVKTAKIYGLSSATLAERIRDSDIRYRNRKYEAQFILDLVIDVFERYENYLKEENKIDFEDMINSTIAALDSLATASSRASAVAPYDLILVDEFQDISYQRLRLLEGLQRLNADSRLFCVGDDWQAIYGFAGSSALFMIGFDRWFASPVRVDLTHDYRNPRHILDFAAEVIERCSQKLFKSLQPRDDKDTDTLRSPLIFKRISGADEFDFRSKQSEAALEVIRNLVDNGVQPSDILVLSRFNFGYADLQQACQNCRSLRPELRKQGQVVRQGVRFMSIHKCKGLEADYVLLLNVFGGLFGFPPEINSKLSFTLINPDLPERMDEERRLLFVAATRAKKQCIVFTRRDCESQFLTENRHYTSHFPTHIQRLFRGHIVFETEKAYKIEAHLSPSFRPVFWVPKSVARIVSSDPTGPVVTIELDEWWYTKEESKLCENAG